MTGELYWWRQVPVGGGEAGRLSIMDPGCPPSPVRNTLAENVHDWQVLELNDPRGSHQTLHIYGSTFTANTPRIWTPEQEGAGATSRASGWPTVRKQGTG